MRAAVYGRNSKPPKGWKPAAPSEEPPGSWALQVQRGIKAAETNGDEVLATVSDVASGGNANRPQWSKVMALVSGGHVGRVYATKLDRVARNLRHFLAIAEIFERRGAELVLLDQPAASIIKTDAAGKAMRSMLATFAEFELDLIRDRSGAVMSIGDDGRVYGPRSDKPAGRPREYAEGHKLRKRGNGLVHVKARCPACRVQSGGLAPQGSDAPQNGGVAEPVGLDTPPFNNRAPILNAPVTAADAAPGPAVESEQSGATR